MSHLSNKIDVVKDMGQLSKVDVLREINGAIRVSSGSDGKYCKNVEEIEKSFYSEEWKVSFLVVSLPAIVVLVITESLTFLGMPEDKSFYVSILFAFCLAAYFLVYCLKKESKEKDKILENEVDISNDVLCTIYSKIQQQIDIEPKFIVNIRELDVLRDCFFDKIPISVENKKLAFLNPKTKTS